MLGICLIVPAWLTEVSSRFVHPLAWPYNLVGPIVGVWLLLGVIYFVYLLKAAPGERYLVSPSDASPVSEGGEGCPRRRRSLRFPGTRASI